MPLFLPALLPPSVTEPEPVTGSWAGNCLLRMKGFLPGKRLKETSNQIKDCWDGGLQWNANEDPHPSVPPLARQCQALI